MDIESLMRKLLGDTVWTNLKSDLNIEYKPSKFLPAMSIRVRIDGCRKDVVCLSYECSAQGGMHINEDHFIAEIIDPNTGEVLPDGEKGELVFTSITKEAFPLLRYRTRDICVLNREKCSCGRTHVRMSKPMGRSDDMLIVKGVNVFPSQIETVLLNKGYPANYQIVVSREKNSDKLEVQVEMTPEMFSDSIREIAAREKELIEALKSMLGIYAVVKLVAPKTIARSEGKAKRVIDNRNLY